MSISKLPSSYITGSSLFKRFKLRDIHKFALVGGPLQTVTDLDYKSFFGLCSVGRYVRKIAFARFYCVF